MSKADVLFVDMCRDILDNGYSSEGQTVRAKWPDGTPAHTIKKFGVVGRYDLSEEFPALTLRPTYIKSAVDELLWIWQKKSNNIHELKGKIWDEWADENGTIGKAYGYQMGDQVQVPLRRDGPGGQCPLAAEEHALLQTHHDQPLQLRGSVGDGAGALRLQHDLQRHREIGSTRC